MVTFELSVKVDPFAKALGREPIKLQLDEFEVLSILKSMSRWNKKLYMKMKINFIDEVNKEYELDIGEAKLLSIKCKSCGNKIKV